MVGIRYCSFCCNPDAMVWNRVLGHNPVIRCTKPLIQGVSTRLLRIDSGFGQTRCRCLQPMFRYGSTNCKGLSVNLHMPRSNPPGWVRGIDKTLSGVMWITAPNEQQKPRRRGLRSGRNPAGKAGKRLESRPTGEPAPSFDPLRVETCGASVRSGSPGRMPPLLPHSGLPAGGAVCGNFGVR